MKGLLKTIFEISGMASILIVTLIAIRRGMAKRLNPRVMIFLWGMALLRLCIPITFQSPINILDLIPQTSIVEEIGDRTPFITPVEQNEILSRDEVSLDRQEKTLVEEPRTTFSLNDNQVREIDIGRFKGTSRPIPILGIMTGIWALGAIGILAGTIRESMLFRKRLLFCSSIEDGEILEMTNAHLESFGIDRQVSILKCNYVHSPGVFGYIRPAILLPDRFIDEMDRVRLDSILLHEVCHIACHDILMNYIWIVAKAIHWFNPLVWIAYRLYQDDVEICRDQMVIRGIGEGDRLEYSASLIQAARFSNINGESSPSIATSLYKNTSKLKERVVRLVKPEKKSRTLSMMSMILATLMLIMCFTTACKPTPQGPAVTGKDSKRLEEAIKVKASGNRETDIQSHKDSFKGADKNVTVNIDADVIIPDEKMPVVKVAPYKIPMDQVKSMTGILFQGNTAYETKIVMTKKELEEKILELKGEIANEEGLLTRFNGDKESVEKFKQNYENRIEEYEKLYEIAPEVHTPRETDWEFHSNTYYYRDEIETEGDEGLDKDSSEAGVTQEKKTAFQATTVIEGYRGAIQVSQDNAFGGVRFGMGNVSADQDFGWWDPRDSKPMDMTKEESVEMVYDALKEMGITHMQLFECRAYGAPESYGGNSHSPEEALELAASGEASSIKEPEEGEDVYSYSLSFVPTYEGIAFHNMSPFHNGGSEHSINHFYEHLSVSIANGMIVGFDWTVPMEKVELENDNVAIIEFKEAVELFKKQMGIEYTIAKLTRTGMEDNNYEKFADDEENKAYYEAMKDVYEDDLKYLDTIQSGEIHITDIELKLMRIKIENRPGEYRMVPAWMFFGHEELHFKDGESKIQEPERGHLYPYGIINALDGSIINISEGY